LEEIVVHAESGTGWAGHGGRGAKGLKIDELLARFVGDDKRLKEFEDFLRLDISLMVENAYREAREGRSLLIEIAEERRRGQCPIAPSKAKQKDKAAARRRTP
jgi:hypothetical protein